MIVTPIAVSSSAMIADVHDRRHVGELEHAIRQRLAAISFSTEFFAPGTTISPSSGPAWRTVMQQSPSAGSDFTGLSMLAPCCAALERSRGSGRTPQTCALAWSARVAIC